MSTRANIVIKDGGRKLFFYRHSDGYPEGTMPTLNIFINWLKSGKIRNNISQGSGWLILLGAIEYGAIPKFESEKPAYEGAAAYGDVATIQAPEDWKVGAYEPTTGIHGDIDYLYIIDLKTKEVTCFEDWTEDGEGEGQSVDLSEQAK